MINQFRNPFVFVLLISIIFSFPDRNLAQDKIKILGVSVVGNKSTSAQMIQVNSGLMEGKMITRDDIRKGINRLWQLSVFSNIQIILEKNTPEGVFLIIQVEEYPKLEKVEFKGVKKRHRDKLEEEINLSPGQFLSPNDISEAKRKILDYYHGEGFLIAEVDEKIEEGSQPNAKRLTFIIKEHSKVKLRKVLIAGNQAFSERRIRRQLKETKGKTWWMFWRGGDFDRDKYEEDLQNLQSFYRDHGYRDFEILKDTTWYSSNKKHLFLELTLYEGPRYKFRNITFEGNHLYDDKTLKKYLGISPGDWYSEKKLNTGLYDRLNGLYMDQGYIYFSVIPGEIPVSDDEVDIICSISEGNPVSVRYINIVGNEKTRENVIRRELKIYPGDTFSRNLLMRSQREVWILNYFSNVLPDVIPVDDDEIDLEITVEEKQVDRANMSMSISGQYGLIGGGGVEFNNFRGLGQRINLSYQQGSRYSLGQITQAAPYRSFSFSFTDPWVFDTPNLVGASLYYSERGGQNLYYFPFDLNLYGGSLQFGRRFRWPDNYFRGNWILETARKEYQNVSQDYLQDVLKGIRHITGNSLTQIITRDSRDRPEFPTNGSVFTWSIVLSGGILGGNEEFHKHRLSIEWFTPLKWKFVVYNNVELGVIKSLGSHSIIPPDERFIMGGSGLIYGESLRGYPDNLVGPRDSQGNPLGGNTMFRYTTELRFSVSDNPTIYLLGFVEAGNTWKNLSYTTAFNLYRSAGVGIRFFMPMLGMIGFDFGYGFDNLDELPGFGKPEGWNTHFVFGMPF